MPERHGVVDPLEDAQRQRHGNHAISSDADILTRALGILSHDVIHQTEQLLDTLIQS